MRLARAAGQYLKEGVTSRTEAAVSPERIAGLEVLATITGGHPRHDAGAFAGLR